MFKKIVLTFLIIIAFSNTSNAQFGIAHEVGIIAGPVMFQSDYGERNDFSTNIGNSSLGIGFVHFFNFSSLSNRETYFNEHFKVRDELSYTKVKLEHFGQWVESSSATSQKLKAMRGKSSLLNIGLQLEYSPFMKIHDFENTYNALSPYFSLGVQLSFYNTEASSKLGPLGTLETTPGKYLVPSDGREHGYSSETGTALSLTFGVGTHYKLTEMSDLMIELRLQKYNSDWIDGLNPNSKIYTENKSNDWQTWLSVGYIHYLKY